ncbi:hypothetical protein ABMY20_12785 [Tenacibaculum sp. SSH1-16]|uniref:hypothetical protein n=1 Tax=Tenacibaculum sp. SSH1-16 TaxID=3136667 RepID=UPI0032C47327
MSIEEIYTQYQNFTVVTGFRPNILTLNEEAANKLVKKLNESLSFSVPPKVRLDFLGCKVIRSKDVDEECIEFAVDIEGVLNKNASKMPCHVQR